MVEIIGGCIVAESVCRVWTKVECGGGKSLLVLFSGTASDLLLGEEQESDGG